MKNRIEMIKLRWATRVFARHIAIKYGSDPRFDLDGLTDAGKIRYTLRREVEIEESAAFAEIARDLARRMK